MIVWVIALVCCSSVGARLGNAGLVLAGGTGRATSPWSISASPNQGGHDNLLRGVACTAVTSCVAVGYAYNASAIFQTLAESWNGISWTLVASPDQGGGGNNYLKDVACTSSTSCEAVGYYDNASDVEQTLIESWNGSTWAIVPSPNNGALANELSAVTCSSPISCLAVGFYGFGGGRTLVESWNGSSWTVVASPNKGNQRSYLSDVACTSATSCVAVGNYVSASNAEKTLAESWNGSTWNIVSSANHAGSDNVLSGVACTSSTSCEAVGNHVNGSGVEQTLVESWNGSAWAIASSPNRGNASNVLYAVSCTSSTNCAAGGFSLNASGVQQTLAESWNGNTWTIASSPDQGSWFNELLGVICTNPSSCMAVGFYANAAYQTLAETWNGTSWSLAPSANQGGSTNDLSAVSCTSSTKCMAVGDTFNASGTEQTLTERWNGTTWALVASPNQGSGNNGFGGVACTGSSSCVAVGTYANTSGTEQTLVESWNGTTWSIIPSPNQGTENNFLSGIACSSTASCVAVGRYFDDSAAANLTLIESWNGSTWSIPPSASQPSSNNSLTGVSCTSSTSCTAVGVSVNGASIAQTLIESWSGSTWSIIPSPNPGSITNELNGVVCTSSTSCVAVGDYFNASNVDRTLVESWDGSAWSVIASPNKGSTNNNALLGLSCTGASSCVAVGYRLNGSSVQQTLVESWNGSTWTVTASPNQGSEANGLNGVACTTSARCTAVGFYESSAVSQNLIETLGA